MASGISADVVDVDKFATPFRSLLALASEIHL